MLTNAEIIILSMQYSHEQIRKILRDVLPDGSNIAQASQTHNILVSAISHWQGRVLRNADAYEVTESPSFILAKIVE